MREGRSPRLWVELDDLIRYFDTSATPTGIGRVQLEVIPRLLAAYPDRIGLCRIGADADDVRMIRPEALASLTKGAGFFEEQRSTSFFALWTERITRFTSRRLRAFLDRQLHAPQQRRDFLDTIEAGDVLVTLGDSWTHVNFGRSLRTLKKRHGLRFFLLVHDVLPITDPELVAKPFLAPFAAWLNDMIETWDAVLTPSRNTADGLEAHLRTIGAPVPPITPIPFGFGFDDSGLLAPKTPIGDEPYVLFVSTIEIRKNHFLLYRVWERLIAKYGRSKIPKLVFAGRMGWGIDDLRRALATSNHLDGKIQIVSNMSDAQMARAYADCQFTLFPSFCEGWGLPVSESLFYGKLCIASNATSIPEVGGPAVDYFDPRNEGEAFERIERALFEPGYLASREAWIAENFRLPTWDDTAQAIFAALLGTAEARAATVSDPDAPEPASPAESGIATMPRGTPR